MHWETIQKEEEPICLMAALLLKLESMESLLQNYLVRMIDGWQEKEKEKEKWGWEDKISTNPVFLSCFYKCRYAAYYNMPGHSVPIDCGRCGTLVKQQQLLALLKIDNERTLNSIKKHKNKSCLIEKLHMQGAFSLVKSYSSNCSWLVH